MFYHTPIHVHIHSIKQSKATGLHSLPSAKILQTPRIQLDNVQWASKTNGGRQYRHTLTYTAPAPAVVNVAKAVARLSCLLSLVLDIVYNTCGQWVIHHLGITTFSLLPSLSLPPSLSLSLSLYLSISLPMSVSLTPPPLLTLLLLNGHDRSRLTGVHIFLCSYSSSCLLGLLLKMVIGQPLRLHLCRLQRFTDQLTSVY